jgi:tellurite resistance protein
MSSVPAEQVAPIDGPLHYLPVALFGSVMGLVGISVAWRLAHQYFGAPLWASAALGNLAIIDFVAMSVAYGTKLTLSPKAVKAEFAHPVAGNFFATFFVSLLLLPIVVAPMALNVARVIWCVGAAGMVGFAVLIIDRWLSDLQQQHVHAIPAWILPVIGMLDVPAALPSLGMPELRWVIVLGFAVGMFFAIPLFTLIMARLIFEPPMPKPLQPTLLILVAPASVGLSAYLTVTGSVDLFAECLFFVSVFLLALLIGRMRFFIRACPFKVGWWAVSFPLAACMIGSIKMAMYYKSQLADLYALVVLGFGTIAIVYLIGRTLFGVARGELRTLTT